MYIQLQADTQEIIDDAKPMICFFCVPKDTENVRANIRGLITQLFKARNYEGPGRYKYTADSLAGIEVCFMSEECFKNLIENTEEIALGIKNLVALLGEDKTIYHRWPKPALPTTETPNPTLTVDRDSVFQATRYLDPLAVIGQKFTIADIVATATTDAVVKIDPVGMNVLALEAKVDKPIAHFTGEFSYLMQWFASAFHGGLFSDINPFTAETFFNRFTRTFNSSTLTYITVPIPLPPFSISVPVWSADSPFIERFTKAFFDTSTNPNHDNAWLSKLFGGFLGAGTGVFATINYHLGEVQYGIKHFFNIFAVGKFDANGNFFQAVKKHWDKPNAEDELQLLQNSVFQNNPDYAGRGFTLYDWLAMWVKPHGTNWQGNGYVNFATNMKGHEPRDIGTGNSEQLDTLIDRFSLAFLQTSNTTPILGKIRDILETGLLFSSSLGILTLINNSLQSIYGVLSVDLGWIARSVEEIADKDCCTNNGSTTVTNPDGSTTTTPNPPVYPPVDPNDPNNPITQEPYEKPPLTQANNADAVCGFIWYTLNECAEWLDWLISWLPSVDWVLKAFGLSGFAVWVAEQAIKWENVYLSKLGAVAIKGIGSKWLGLAGVAIDMLPDYIREIRDDLSCGSQRTDVKVDELETEIIEALQTFTLQNQVLDFAAYVIHIFYSYGLYSPLENATGINIADYAQYCPCPTEGCECGDPWAAFSVQNWPTPSQSVVALQPKPATGFEVQYYDMTVNLSGIGALDCIKDMKFDWAGGTVQPAWNGGWNAGGLALMNSEPNEQANTSIVSWSVGVNSVSFRVGIYRKSSDAGNFIRASIIYLGTCQ